MESKLLHVPLFKQETEYTCGPSSLRMVFAFFGIPASEEEFTKLAGTTEKSGTTPVALSRAPHKKGMYAYVQTPSSYEDIVSLINTDHPVIISYFSAKEGELHYSVAVGYHKDQLILNDPWDGEGFTIPREELSAVWYDRYQGKRYDKWALILSDKEISHFKNVKSPLYPDDSWITRAPSTKF